MSAGGHAGEQHRVAVLAMAYGTPHSPEEILPYYTDIRRGRPPTGEQLADLVARYDAIGGISPLAERTKAQCIALQRALDDRLPGHYHVALGLKHAAPQIEDAVAELATEGFTRVVGLVLAPHWSTFSVGQYLQRMRDAAARHGMATAAIESWGTEPAFVDFIADDLVQRLATMPRHTRVLFTAHSLPQRILDSGDPYPDELAATARAVATAIGLPAADDADDAAVDLPVGRERVPGASWSIAWQSAGRTPEPWIGPDVLDAIDDLAAERSTEARVRGVLVSAVGFVADHLEVLYDLDIEAARRAERCGLAFTRTACVNDDPGVMAALAGRIIAADQVGNS